MSDGPSPAACGVVLTGRLKECEAFTEMLLWFADVPGRKCIYSIHNMVQVRQYVYTTNIRPYVCVCLIHTSTVTALKKPTALTTHHPWDYPWCLLVGWWVRWA